MFTEDEKVKQTIIKLNMPTSTSHFYTFKTNYIVLKKPSHNIGMMMMTCVRGSGLLVGFQVKADKQED